MQPKKQLKVQYIGIFWAWVDLPPLIHAMSEKKLLFFIEAFPKEVSMRHYVDSSGSYSVLLY